MMTLEQAAIGALTFMVGFCGVLLRILWDRSNTCEKDRLEMHVMLETQARQIGILDGTLKVVAACPIPNCPYRPHIQPLP